MRKKDLILDFTSLLDVIMIILFAVLFLVGQASKDAKVKAEEELKRRDEIEAEMLSENEAIAAEMESRAVDYEDALSAQAEEYKAGLLAQTAEFEALLSEKDMLLSEVNEAFSGLQRDYDTLLSEAGLKDEVLQDIRDENVKLKAKAKESGLDNADLYEALMHSTTRITMFCETHESEEKTNANEVVISVYAGEGETFGQQAIVVFPHDFKLSKDERLEANTKMKADLYRVFSEILENDTAELVLFTVEYVYGDVNFSQTDLDIIAAAAADVESLLHKTCYIDKIRK